MTHPAITELAAAFTDPFRELGRNAGSDAGAVVLSWPAVPIEIIHACGLRAVLARSAQDPTPAADLRLERGVFPVRLHQLVEAALTGRLAHVAGIILPRTSDPDYKCFLYLREFARRGIGGPFPPVVLFDFLQSDGPEIASYNGARAKQLMDQLGSWSGSRPHPDDLGAAIHCANAARAAANRLQALRGANPRLAGQEAMPALAAFWQLAPERYAQLADSIVSAVRTRSVRSGPRVLLAGSPVDSPALHAVVEAQGATIVDELGPYGRDATGDPIDPGADGLAALVQRYRMSPTSARTPLARMRQRIESALADADTVVVHEPMDDATFGWDYPWLRSLLAQRGIGHVVTRVGPSGVPPEHLKALGALLKTYPHRAAARHG